MSDFHRASQIVALLHICRITNASNANENCYLKLNRELRWLRNSVYMIQGGQCTSQSLDFSDIVHIHLVTKTSTSGKKIDSYAEHTLHS